MEQIFSDQFRKTLLLDSYRIFKKHGVRDLSEADLLKNLNVSPSTFRELAGSKDELFKLAALEHMKNQRVLQQKIIDSNPNAIHQLMGLLKMSLDEIKDTSPAYLADFMSYPDLWAKVESEMEQYSIPLYRKILNNGIKDGYFRKDINIEIVIKVIMKNLMVLLDFKTFPPERYDIGEVLRSIYLYYFRGLCVSERSSMVDSYFAEERA
jgi:AcrR family transcriptional regulator